MKHPCPNCKVKCVDGTDNIQCGKCHNWFHFGSTNLSKKYFLDLKNLNRKTYSCHICKYRVLCSECNSSLDDITKYLYCIGCLKKTCLKCHELEIQQINSYVDTDKSYFCTEHAALLTISVVFVISFVLLVVFFVTTVTLWSTTNVPK